MIVADNLSKMYGRKRAVKGISFEVRPGRVTGLVGPNGSGKSTTLKMLLGLIHPTAGSITIEGRRYAEHRNPLHVVGTLLDDAGPLPERRGIDHVRWLAKTHGIPSSRVRQMLHDVGLSSAARIRVRKYSLGMKQRLGIAGALLGDPSYLVLDEPLNGLDPEAIRWIKKLMRKRADEGGSVLLSSHFMRDLESVADDIIMISGGSLVYDGGLSGISNSSESPEDAYFRLTQGR